MRFEVDGANAIIRRLFGQQGADNRSDHYSRGAYTRCRLPA